jgi:integrase/recombinase XerD
VPRTQTSDEEPPRALAVQLSDFLTALRVEAGLSRATLAAYRSNLGHFLSWSRHRGLQRPADIDAVMVVDYLAHRRAEGLAESTVSRDLTAIRMWMRYLVAEGLLERDPTSRLQSPVLAKLLPHTLGVEEVDRLLRAPDGTSWRDQRDRALLEVLYACGARISEAVGLTTDRMDSELRVVRLLGKGSKERVVPVGARAREALGEWIENGRPQLPGSHTRREVFLSHTGKPLDRTNAWRRVKAAALRAGLSRDVHPHSLRHSFASHMLAGGADLRAVQEMLGHASIRTTEIYTHLDEDHIRGLHRLYHPRG